MKERYGIYADEELADLRGRARERKSVCYLQSVHDTEPEQPPAPAPPAAAATAAALDALISSTFMIRILCAGGTAFKLSCSNPPWRTPTRIIASRLCAAFECAYTPPWNAAVASRPTFLVRRCFPPGCSSRNEERSWMNPETRTSGRVRDCAWTIESS